MLHFIAVDLKVALESQDYYQKVRSGSLSSQAFKINIVLAKKKSNFGRLQRTDADHGCRCIFEQEQQNLRNLLALVSRIVAFCEEILRDP